MKGNKSVQVRVKTIKKAYTIVKMVGSKKRQFGPKTNLEGRLTRHTIYYPELPKVPELYLSRGDVLEIVPVITEVGTWFASEATVVELQPRYSGVGVIALTNIEMDPSQAHNWAFWCIGHIRNPDIKKAFCIPTHIVPKREANAIRPGDLVYFTAALTDNNRIYDEEENVCRYTCVTVERIPIPTVNAWIGLHSRIELEQAISCFVRLLQVLLFNEHYAKKEESKKNKLENMYLQWSPNSLSEATILVPPDFRVKTGQVLVFNRKEDKFTCHARILSIESKGDELSTVQVLLNGMARIDMTKRHLGANHMKRLN